ncbi:glycosyl hydrolase 53 family protein [Microbacterium sp. STN6]|uniref:glycoside hydrolase family 53 protein n=1 Tax=Microbacterium sp. STN6 TaxID=2995588 RepID=UPI002260F9E8|nr:glycosyl hydrolase 53 family protein [Microbacterium sp. STN6]MCX7522641.1 glycosyl hydrolase 53 family protein [Microbacterium sp. STN6]
MRRSWVLGAAAVLAAPTLALAGFSPAAATPGHGGAAPASVAVVNAGFESGLDGWRVDGPAGSAKIEADGHDSAHRLTHWLAADGTVTTAQTVTGLARGWWTLRASVKSGGGVDTSQLRLTGCGLDGATTVPSTEADDVWLQLTVSAYVTKGSCTLQLHTAGTAGAWASMDDVSLVPGQVTRQIRGADLSSVPKNEDHGAIYRDAAGHRVDPVKAFAAAGANLVRLKAWVTPPDGYNDTAHVVAMAKRAKAAGMKVLIDFHYSDTWADPGKQTVPSAWQGMTAAQMTTALSDYTTGVMRALRVAGITPYAAQIGNEINPGILWPLGQTWDVDPSDGVADAQWDNLAAFLTAGHDAVKAVSPTTKTILHLTNINNGIDSLTWWFDEITAHHVPYDLIGLSYYSYWHGSLADLQNAVSTLSARYDKDVLVVETAYPFTLEDNTNPAWENSIDHASELTPGYPATPEGQAANFRAVQDVVAAAPGGRGLGAVYWEPAWTDVAGNGWDPADPASGNAWENQAMFDYTNRELPAMADFTADPATPPPGWGIGAGNGAGNGHGTGNGHGNGTGNGHGNGNAHHGPCRVAV